MFLEVYKSGITWKYLLVAYRIFQWKFNVGLPTWNNEDQEKVLLLYGLAEDSLEQALGQVLETDTRAGDPREIHFTLDDFINDKTGKNILGCANVFDHQAKQNQSIYSRVQNNVSIELLKWSRATGMLAFEPKGYYHLKKDIKQTASQVLMACWVPK